MRHQSPIHSFQQSERLYAQSPLENREHRTTSVTPCTKITKVTVHPVKSIVRPVQRTVKLYENVNVTQSLTHLDCTQINELQSQVETWRIKYLNLEKEFYNRSDRSAEAETYKMMLRENSESYESQLNALRQELQTQKVLFSQELQQSVESERLLRIDLENKLALLSSELERVNMLLASKHQQYELSLKKLESEKFNLETQLKVRDEVIEERNREMSNFRRVAIKVPELENIIFLSRAENDRLFTLIDQFQGDLEERSVGLRRLEVEQQRLISSLDQRNMEILRWREQVEKLEAEKNEEIDVLRRRIREFQEYNGQLKAEVEDLIGQRSGMYEQLNSRTREVTTLNHQVREYESSVGHLQSELQGAQMRKDELQHKVCLLSTEIENLHHKLRLKCTDLERRIEENDVLSERVATFEVMKEKLHAFEEEIARLKGHIEDLENKCALLCTENERLNNIIEARDQKIASHETYIVELQETYTTEVSDLQRQLNESRQQLEKLNLICIELEGKVDYKEKLFNRLNEEYEFEEKKNAVIIEQLKCEVKELTQELQNRIDERNLTVQTMQDEYNRRYQVWQYELTQTKNALNEFQAKHQELQDKHDDLQVKHDDQQLKHDELQAMHDNLQSKHDDLKIIHQLLNKDHDDLQVKHEDLQVKHEDQQVKHDLYAAQQEAIVGELQNRIKELEDQLNKNQDEMQGYNEEYELLQTETKETITYLNSELDSWKHKFITLNREFHKTQEDLMLVQAEYDAFKQRKTTVITETKRSTILLNDKEKENSERKSTRVLIDKN